MLMTNKNKVHKEHMKNYKHTSKLDNVGASHKIRCAYPRYPFL